MFHFSLTVSLSVALQLMEIHSLPGNWELRDGAALAQRLVCGCVWLCVTELAGNQAVCVCVCAPVPDWSSPINLHNEKGSCEFLWLSDEAVH